MRDSFILYTDQKEAVDELSDEDAGKLFKAIYEYNKTNKIKVEGMLKVIFMQFKVFLDKDFIKWEEEKNKRVEAGRLGGIQRAINKKQALSSKSKQCLDMLSNTKQTQANQADNVNVNVNVNYNNKIYIVDIIDYLNQKTNSKYKTNTPKTISLINARLKEKYTLDDFKLVIDKKCKEWLGTEMEKYLRPETLFGNKFESYLNQKEYEKPKTQKEMNLEFLERMKNNG